MGTKPFAVGGDQADDDGAGCEPLHEASGWKRRAPSGICLRIDGRVERNAFMLLNLIFCLEGR